MKRYWLQVLLRRNPSGTGPNNRPGIFLKPEDLPELSYGPHTPGVRG